MSLSPIDENIGPLGEEEEPEEEEHDGGQDVAAIVHAPPKLEWILTNSSWKVEIRVWDTADKEVKAWALELFERSMKALGKKI